MSTENFQNVPVEFKRMVESFYGCTAGNINSPIWLCGLEWGGGHDPSVPIPIQDLEPYGFEELHCWTTKEFWANFWASESKFCQAVVKLLIGIRDGEYTSRKRPWNLDFLTETNLIGPKGLALTLNAFPISMHGTAQRWNNWNTYQVRLADGTPLLLKDWTNLHTYDDYSKFVFQYRTSTYSNELQKRRPQLVVCFGYNDGHERLFGVKEGQLSLPDSFPCSGSGSNDCFLYLVPHTNSDTYSLILVTPFPQGSYGLNSDEKIKIVTKKITEIGRKYFGENWLKSWPRERQPDLLSESEENEYTILLNRKKKLADVVHAASFELAKLEILESQLSNDKSKECKTILDHILSAKQEQHLLMTNLTKQILVLDKHITDIRTAFKYQYFTQFPV